MADPKDPNDFSKALNDALRSSTAMQKALQNNALSMEDLAGFADAYAKNIKKSNEYLRESVDVLKQFSTTVGDIGKQYEKNLELLGDSEEMQRINNLLAQDMVDELKTKIQLSVMQNTTLKDTYAQSLAQYLVEHEITDELKVQEFLTSEKGKELVEHLKTQQDTYEAIKSQNDLTKEIAANLLEITDNAESYKQKFIQLRETAKAIVNDPATLAFFSFEVASQQLEKLTGKMEEFKQSGMTAGQGLEATFKGMSLESMLGLSDTTGAIKGFTDAFGGVQGISKEVINDVGKMAHHFGISGEEAGTLAAAMSKIPGETAESATHAMEMTGKMAEMQGIAPGKIMKDMAANTGEMSRAGAKGAEEFGKSVVALHKMGVELGTASKIADGLLDFESSINSQMEASVLLGKEINLDKAREMALNNDLEGMTAEIAKNIGGAAEFGKMNRLEQDALAKSVGMSVDELAGMMDAQEESNKYFGEGASLASNAMGYMLEAGKGAAGFLSENAMTLMVILQLMNTEKAMKIASFVWDKAKLVVATIYHTVAAGTNMLLNSRLLIGTKDFVMEKAKIGFAYVQQGLLQGRVAMESFLNNTKVGMWIKEKAHWVAEKAHMVWKMAQERMGIATKAAASTQQAATTATTAASSAASGAGAAAGLTGLATGLSAMGTPAVLFGALNLIAAVPGLVLMVAAIPFLLAVSMLGVPAGAGLSGLGGGLTAMANPMLAMAGVNLMAFALASVIGVAGIPFLAMIALVGIPAGAGLSALGAGLSAMANPAVAIGAAILSGLAISLGASILMMGIGIGIAAAGLSLMFAELAKMPIEQMLLLPVALGGIAIGLGALAVASFFAFPGLLLASWALGGFAASLALLQPIMEMGGLTAIAEGMTAISASAGGLSEVSLAVMGIGTGLGMMALAGLAALPIIGALVGLAAVAPMLSSLGSMFGGGGEKSSEDDKMQVIADKLDQLIAVASAGGDVNLDGRKVGQILKLGLNSSNVR
jgi:hypothetical protein